MDKENDLGFDIENNGFDFGETAEAIETEKPKRKVLVRKPKVLRAVRVAKKD